MSAGTLVKRYSVITCLLKFCCQSLFVRLAFSAIQKSLFETPQLKKEGSGLSQSCALYSRKIELSIMISRPLRKMRKQHFLFLISLFTLNSPIFGCLGMLCRKIFFLFAIAVFQFSYVTGWFSVFFWAQPRNHTRH